MGRMQLGWGPDVPRRRRSRARGRHLPVALAVTLTAFGAVFLGQVFAAQTAATISIEDATTPEGGPENSDHAVSVPVRLSEVSPVVVTVNWATADGSTALSDRRCGGGPG